MANESIPASDQFKAARYLEPVAAAADELRELRGHCVGPRDAYEDPYDRCSARLRQIEALCSFVSAASESSAFKRMNEDIQLAYFEVIQSLASAASVDLHIFGNGGGGK